ncbi:histone-lysine N-methyltransferase SMYD3-like [Sitodiplosis mosellana]|uniref:histone-lysine N-methyltransferase SMYD3-like n=1 Tax=Sitodiplosis mosellana TaxID=263140 RepID=UPI0024437FAD|nr:histone-lysine N-methyltransferase SMYD3-like [Sitodiplosis mosellana]
MDSLWRKEANRVESLYINLFKSTDSQFVDETKKWDEHVQTLKSKHSEVPAKNNEKSSELIRKGSELFCNKQFYHAMELYTKALCYAEVGTENESMAFASRAKCFFYMKMYQQAMTDIELALEANCPAEMIVKLEKLRADCRKVVISNSNELTEPKRSFTDDRNFPCIANTLTITNNTQFGRHLVAKCDIDVGQMVLMEQSFASVAKSDEQMTCYNCLTEVANFIACSKCSDVVFCSNKCLEENLVHQLDCNTPYHRMHCKAKFTIQTILIAVAAFPNIDDLIECVEAGEKDDVLPESITDLQSKYRLYLRLKKLPLNANVVLDVYKLFKSIMIIPSIERAFDSEGKQRFLMHLILHHLAINVTNATESEYTASIGTVLSLLNHSCAPNLYNYSVDNRKFCVTIRPVKKGEQLFISYLGPDDEQTAKQRQHLLKTKWNFECKCDKCEPRGQIADSTKMKLDPCFKFIQRTFKTDQVDNMNTSAVKKKCIKFLTKYGHLPFSNELKYISDIYTTLI